MPAPEHIAGAPCRSNRRPRHAGHTPSEPHADLQLSAARAPMSKRSKTSSVSVSPSLPISGSTRLLAITAKLDLAGCSGKQSAMSKSWIIWSWNWPPRRPRGSAQTAAKVTTDDRNDLDVAHITILHGPRFTRLMSWIEASLKSDHDQGRCHPSIIHWRRSRPGRCRGRSAFRRRIALPAQLAAAMMRST